MCDTLLGTFLISQLLDILLTNEMQVYIYEIKI